MELLLEKINFHVTHIERTRLNALVQYYNNNHHNIAKLIEKNKKAGESNYHQS